jgi:hypothetical protein
LWECILYGVAKHTLQGYARFCIHSSICVLELFEKNKIFYLFFCFKLIFYILKNKNKNYFKIKKHFKK